MTKREFWQVLAFVGLIIAIQIAGLIYILPHNIDWSQALPALLHKRKDKDGDWTFLLLIFVACAHLIWHRLSASYERITISKTGISYRSPYQGRFEVLQRFQPDWKLAWKDVKDIWLERPSASHANFCNLKIRGANKVHVVVPRWWHIVGSEPKRLKRFHVFMRIATRQRLVAQQTLESPLVVELGKRGYRFDVEALRAPTPVGYDIAKHRGLYGIVVVFIAAVMYALFDTFILNPYWFAGTPPHLAACAIGIFAAYVAFLIGRGAPIAERLIVATLFGGAIGATSYSASLRINQWTAQEGPLSVTYRYTGGQFEPVRSGYPTLHFAGDGARKMQQKTSQEIVLLRGSLGFYQLDLVRLRKDLDAYIRIGTDD